MLEVRPRIRQFFKSQNYSSKISDPFNGELYLVDAIAKREEGQLRRALKNGQNEGAMCFGRFWFKIVKFLAPLWVLTLYTNQEVRSMQNQLFNTHIENSHTLITQMKSNQNYL